MPARSDRLIFLPLFGALLGMWVILAVFTGLERRTTMAQAQSQLAATAAMLADFSELALQGSAVSAGRASESRTAGIWRVLLQYPTASVWVEADGVVTAGQPPPEGFAGLLRATEQRERFAVHMALPESDVLAAWWRAVWQRSTAMIVVTLGFLLLARLLAGALRARAAAERAMVAERERATQLNAYRAQLERTVAERTAELTDANSQLGRELTDRKTAETALREHDALLHVVTRSAAEMLGSHHAEPFSQALGLIGEAVKGTHVLLTEMRRDAAGHLRSWLRHEWVRPGMTRLIDEPMMQNADHGANPIGVLVPEFASEVNHYTIDRVSPRYRAAFEDAQMRSFLQIPVFAKERQWGVLSLGDARADRVWKWAETDTLKTLANLIGVAITSAQFVRELADANMIVQNSPTILYRLRGEPTFPLMYVSHNIVKFGHDPQRLAASGDWLQTLVEPADRPKVEAAMARVLEKDAQGASIEYRLLTGDGGHRWVENRYTPVRDREGRLCEIEGIIIDITERKSAEDKIALLARTDSLTGLANRAMFLDRLRQMFAATRRGASSFAILYIDLDHFKDVNDTLGHPVGDQLLCEVADRLRSLTRDSDLVARLGGDEFAILQGELLDPADAGTLAGKVQKSLAAPYALSGNDVSISASIGICAYAASSASPDSMLTQADLALYRSKDEGRNQYHFHSDDLDREVLERVAIADELRRAMDDDQLELYYQPQVDIATGGIEGMEALVRWNHPSRGTLSAGAFLPAAEKSGLMPSLGHFVLDEACRQMRAWRDEGVAPPVVSVNLSASQLRSARELLRDVVDTTAKHGISPSSLEFDVTEATLAQATWTQNDVLQQLHAVGARIAIADFGTEYSSFDYLRSYHVSHLKMAQEFIGQGVEDAERAATIRSIISLARELDIGVIAEGVETEEQRRLLASTGTTTHAQGFLFSEPVNASRAADLLRRGLIRNTLPPLRTQELANELLSASGGQR